MPEEDTRAARFPRFQEENFRKNLELADKVREISDEKGITPASSRSPGCCARETT
jgi:aryl-alcohol dehydrogenase-like predicted oxidoreductase